MFLVGDVGGTKVRLALAEQKKKEFILSEIREFASKDYAGLKEIIAGFLEDIKTDVEAASFGVPGPIIKGEARTTNLPWKLSEPEIVAATELQRLKLVNDLVATSASLPYLASEDLVTLYEGPEAYDGGASAAVLAPGTGLGQGFLACFDGKQHSLPSEGGHVDFAPRNETEIELLRYLLTMFSRVSYERVLCGPGLVNIYDFLVQTERFVEPPELRQRLQSDDAAAVISETGQRGEFEICAEALDMFVSILGSQAGNVVLSLVATGGIYLGGGIPPKILKKLMDGTIVKSYLAKGRLSNLVEQTPLYVIRDDRAALLGAAHFASGLT